MNEITDEMAISPVIGIILMVASTIVIAGIIMTMIGGFVPPDIPPYAIISVSDAEGGLLGWTPSVTFENNSIRILHRSGNMLCINETMIVMQGYGQSRPTNTTGVTGWWGANASYPIHVTYKHIHSRGKSTGSKSYIGRNSNLLADRYWSAGEILNLNGHDSYDTNATLRSITVIRIGNTTDTTDNWRFKANSKVSLLIIDIPSNRVISSTTFTMRQFT